MTKPRRFILSSLEGGAVVDGPIGVGMGNPTRWLETSEGRIINNETSLTFLHRSGAVFTWWADGTDSMQIEDLPLPVVVLHESAATSCHRRRLADGTVSYEVQFPDGGSCAYTQSPGGLLQLRSQRMDCQITDTGMQMCPRTHDLPPRKRHWPGRRLLKRTLMRVGLMLMKFGYGGKGPGHA